MKHLILSLMCFLCFASCRKEPEVTPSIPSPASTNKPPVADLSPAIQWQKALGGTRVDVAQSIQPTADGGYILAGNTNPQDGDVSGYHSGSYSCYIPCIGQTICGLLLDGLVVKLTSTGAMQWQIALGGSSAENLLSIQATPDGGYIASGLTYSNDGDVSGYHGGTEADAWVVKLSSSGAIQWQKVFGGSTGCNFGNAILSTPDGGYIVAGYTYFNNGDVSGNHGDADAWIVKLSSSGAIQWQKALGGSKGDIAKSIQPTADGGYIVAGSTRSNNGDISGNHGDADAWIVKLSSSGSIQWQKALGGSIEDLPGLFNPPRMEAIS